MWSSAIQKQEAKEVFIWLATECEECEFPVECHLTAVGAKISLLERVHIACPPHLPELQSTLVGA
jgi:hypothetical protein